MDTAGTLITVPARVERAEDLEPIFETLASLRGTAPAATVLVVDDRSPVQFAQVLEAAAAELECAYVMQEDGVGAAGAYNVGLAVANEHGLDVVTVETGLVYQPGWLDRLAARTAPDGTLAPVVGGAVLETAGLIRQAGYFFSLFRRSWSARLARVPSVLLDVHTALLCPVSTEMMLVRHSSLERIGPFDELMDGPHLSLDYCITATVAGAQCVFEPSARAIALEGRDGEPKDGTPGAERLRFKHAGVSFQRWAPEVI